MHSKKGIQPLVATGLLVGLAMTLGIVVMNFGRAQVETGNACDMGVELKWVKISDKDQICFNKGKSEISFIVENGPSVDVEGVRLRSIGEKSIFVQDVIDSAIKKGDALMKGISYDLEQYGSIRQLKLTPKIKVYEEEAVCADQALSAEKLRDCE